MALFEMPADLQEDAPSDSLGKRTLDSGLYKAKIKLAYLDQSDKGAVSVNLIVTSSPLDGDANTSKETRFTEYVTSNNEKGTKPYYVDKSGNKRPLPGFSRMNDLLIRATGKSLNDQAVEPKNVKVWSKDAQQEVPQEKNVFIDALNTEVILGIIEIKENKYSDPSQHILKNEIDKVFDSESRLTSAEIVQGKDAPEFIQKWAESNAGKVRDKTKKVGSVSGAPASNSSGSTPNIFSK